LRLDRQAVYCLASESYIDNSLVEIHIKPDESAKKPPSDYATLRKEQDNKYILHANAKNKLGSIVLVATYEGKEYTKTVQIIPLW